MLLLLLMMMSQLLGLGAGAPKDNVGMLNIQSLVQGQVPLCLFIPCTFKLPPSLANEKASNLEGQWFRNLSDPPVASTNKRRPVQSHTANRFLMLGNLKAKNCSLMVRSVHRDDQAIYRFVVLKGQHMFHFDRNLHFQVSEKQLPPSITLSHPLRAGVATNVTCSVPWVCTWQPPVISWLLPLRYKMGPQKTLSSSISVIPTWRNNPISLKCHVIIDGFKLSASKEAMLDLRCDSIDLEKCKEKPEPEPKPSGLPPLEAKGSIPWLLIILVALLEAVLVGLFGACVSRYLYRKKRRANTFVKRTDRQPELAAQPESEPEPQRDVRLVVHDTPEEVSSAEEAPSTMEPEEDQQ